MNYITKATVAALLVGLVLGIAYGDSLPLLPTLAKKLPGARQ